MGVPEDNPMSREPIYYLNFTQGIERLAQNQNILHTDDQDGIQHIEDYYRNLHEKEWLNKWYPRHQNNFY